MTELTLAIFAGAEVRGGQAVLRLIAAQCEKALEKAWLEFPPSLGKQERRGSASKAWGSLADPPAPPCHLDFEPP